MIEESKKSMSLEETANRIHDEAIIIDGRDPTHLMYGFTLTPKSEYPDILHQGGFTAVMADAAWVDDNFGQAARAVGAWYRRVRDEAARARIAHQVEDIKDAKRKGEIAFILSFQSPTPVEDNLDLVDLWQQLGLRVMQLTYQTRTLLGDGCAEKSDAGLSRFGRGVIERMNECGILVDLSHAGHRTAMDATRVSSKPVILSHTNARALCDTPRNAHDELLEAVAASGGVVGVSAYSPIVKKGGGETGTTVDDYLDQLDYIVNLIGEDHVGLGFDAGEMRTVAEAELLHAKITAAGPPVKHRYVAELKTRTGARAVTQGLVERDYSESTIRKFLGGNFLRVFSETW